MASITTNRGRKLILDGTVDLLTDTLKVMLVNGSYTPNKDHNFASSLNTYELTGTGYVGGYGGSGRKTLASKTVTQDDTNDVAVFDAGDITWTAINAGTAAYAAIIKEVTNDAASPVLAVIDLSPDVVTNGGDLTIQWGAGGILSFASS